MSSTEWTIQEISKYYSEYAQVYDQDIKYETYPAPFIISEWIVQELQAREKQNCTCILDVGCGTGQSSRRFFEFSSFSVYGVDACQEMLDKAMKLPFKQLKCTNIQHEFGFKVLFDAAICVGVMDFVANPMNVFDQVGNNLKVGGIFGLTMPEFASVNSCNEFITSLELQEWSLLRKERFYGYKDSQSNQDMYYMGFLFSKL